MDINRYSEMKKRRTIKISAVNGMLIIYQQKFCPETGAELDPNIQPVQIKAMKESVDQQIVALEASLNSLREFRADIEAAATEVKKA